ncbi:hypothetical protein AVEN_178229-1 [Araneus ventricosus]|uniref:CCHC-type domain-containing protein n=2 Tax=Araneus ventricosus TaxID=182803 RepID=A0A4Y2H4Z5_ARAVE|nr:hypothetical protein AVEN_140887-1 [Araneus ventricosus]GBM61203.1 hypothetical protein AVEN_178229-1 [Araneus ventricosus]
MGKKKNYPFSGHQKDFNSSLNEPFDSFFIMKRISSQNENFHSVSPFLVQKGINSSIGDVKSIRKLRSGDLLIEVSSRKQAQQIAKLNALSTLPVTVSAHSTLNSSKGVVTCGELLHTPTEEIAEDLKCQGVTHVRRIKIRREGKLLDTKHLVLTFHSPKLPQSIKAGYMNLAVKPYIPNPLRCFKCQRFGHSKLACRGTLACARCGEKNHDSLQCTAQEKCANCKGNHTSHSRSCPSWQFEKEVISVKIKQQISYPEARKIVKAQTPTGGTSYSAAIKQSVLAKVMQINPTDTMNDSTTSEKTLKPPKDMHLVFDIPSSSTIPTEQPESNTTPDLNSDSHDASDFKTVTKKRRPKKPPKITTENQRQLNSEKGSKFWTTSPLQASTSATMQVDDLPPSLNANNCLKVTGETKSLSVNSASEPIPMDDTCNKTDKDTESSEIEDAINYDPHETIEEMPAVVEEQQQPSTNSTCLESTTIRQQSKKCHFRFVDFKTFYNPTLSTPVHDKYLKKHQIKRLQ